MVQKITPGGSTLVMGSARHLLASFVSTLGVGSTWEVGDTLVTNSPFISSRYKTLVGIMHAESSNLVVNYEQSGVNSPWDISSTTGVAVENALLDFTNYGQFGQLSITTVISAAAGDVLRFHVYGVPI